MRNSIFTFCSLLLFLLLSGSPLKAQSYPEEATTGPTGTLSYYSGNMTVSTNGAVIENMEITGKVYIKANNITIRNCNIGSLDIASADSYTGTVLEDCELGWAGRHDFTLRRCKMITQSNDLIRIGGPNVIIEDCFLYATGPRIADEHTDIIQEYPTNTGENAVIRHNTMWIGMGQNASIFSVTDVLIENNLIAGGGYPIYMNETQTIINNHFSTKFYPTCGQFGTATGQAGCASGNVWHETGQPVNLNCLAPCTSVPVTGVSVSPTSLSIEAGTTSDLTETVSPSDATDKSVTWASGNTSIATVNSSGVVTGISQGSTTITVTTNDGGYTANCTVNVTPASGDTNLALNKSVSTSSEQTPNVGSKLVDNDTNDDSRWSASGFPQSAIIDLEQECNLSRIEVFTYQDRAYQYIVEASNDGSNYTQIVDRSSNTSSSQPITDIISTTGRYIKITVNSASGYTGSWVSLTELRVFGNTETIIIEPDGVSVSPSSVTIDVGGTSDLTETVSPSNATDKSVTWSSNNSAVATVDANGVVSALSGGNATITVTTNTGGFTASCAVTVNVPVTGVAVSPTTLSLETGQTGQLSASIAPTNASDQSVSWSTNDASVATVNANGTVTAVGEGSCIITVATNVGSYTATSAITVTDPGQQGTNLALNKAISVSAYQDDSFGYKPGENLVDGDVSDDARWSASGFPQWAEIDLGENCDLTQIDLYPYQERAYQYIVEAKPDGGSYATIVDRSSNTTGGDVLSDNVNTTARYVKITVSALYGGSSTWVSLAELEVYGTITQIIPDRTETITASTDDLEVRSNGSTAWVGSSTARVGGAGSGYDGALVMPFQLPALNAGETILSASFSAQLKRIANSPAGNVDLYGLPFRSSSSVSASTDFYQGAFNGDASATGIQDDFAIQGLADEILISTDASGESNLASYISAQYASGAQAGDYIFLRLNPDVADVANYHYWEFYTANSSTDPTLEIVIGSGSAKSRQAKSISSFPLEASLSIWPNPAQGNQAINLIVNGFTANEELQISIFDISGRAVYNTAVFTQESGNLNECLQLMTVRQGIYILTVGNTTKQLKSRIVIE